MPQPTNLGKKIISSSETDWHNGIWSAGPEQCRSSAVEHRLRLCPDRPDRPIFPGTHTPESQILDPTNWRMTTRPGESRRQVKQQRRFNFRDSIGCFETSRLGSWGGPTALFISVMSSKSGQAAKQLSSAWTAPELDRTGSRLAGPLLTTPEPQSLWPSRIIRFVLISNLLELPVLLDTHLHVSSDTGKGAVLKSPVARFTVTVCSAPFGRPGGGWPALEMFPLVH